jgi:quinol monooxygenase YgiN
MIVEYLRYTVDEARADAFVEAYRAASEPLLRSPHCLSFDLARAVEAPGSFILRIEWSSAEDHMDRFRNSPEFRKFFSHVRPYVGAIEEMRHYERLLSRDG